MKKEVRDKFREYQETGTCRLKFKTKKRGETGTGVEVGKKWHTSIHNYLQSLENKKQESDEEGEAVIKALKSKESIVESIEFLQSEFPLFGFMTDKENSEINFWKGKADAIGWLDGNYVIVDWKAVDLLDFWEKDRHAYGDYLHQCLVYARLLQLHLKLKELPYILIVPISNTTGKDIHPALFRDFPRKCKRVLEDYRWSKEFVEIFVEIDVHETLLNEEIFTELEDDGIVPDEAKVTDVFDKDVTVRQLLDALRLNLSKLKVA